MTPPFRIALQARDRLYVNGAVLRVDRKVDIEFLNDATFLSGGHVLRPEETTTPLRQLYYVVQSMLIDPDRNESLEPVCAQMLAKLIGTFDHPDVLAGLRFVDLMVGSGHRFESLKTLKALFPIEDEILNGNPAPGSDVAHDPHDSNAAPSGDKQR